MRCSNRSLRASRDFRVSSSSPKSGAPSMRHVRRFWRGTPPCPPSRRAASGRWRLWGGLPCRASSTPPEAARPPAAPRVERALALLERPSLRRVINATGVVLHTTRGRAPLGPLSIVAGYSNLEFDVAAGRRGQRDVHTGSLLERLVGAPAIAVNNNAAAVFLALHELASGGEVIVSRGELIEIGDGFRIPDIMARSGATLQEVGTTNRTRIDDYRAAITGRTR